MPALLFQKLSKISKSKDQLKSLERRFEFCKENINKLYKGGKAIKDWVKSDWSPNNLVKMSKKSKLQMQNGIVNETLKILTSNMSGGIWPLADEKPQLSELKHPDAKGTT